MKTEYILTGVYVLLGFLNIYCFVFQRTARKIRQFAFGTQLIEIENKFLPDWYSLTIFISYLRFIPLIWLLVIDWKFAIIAYIVMGIIKLIIPIDYFAIMKILKRNFEKKINAGIASDQDNELYNVIVEVEKKTTKF